MSCVSPSTPIPHVVSRLVESLTDSLCSHLLNNHKATPNYRKCFLCFTLPHSTKKLQTHTLLQLSFQNSYYKTKGVLIVCLLTHQVRYWTLWIALVFHYIERLRLADHALTTFQRIEFISNPLASRVIYRTSAKFSHTTHACIDALPCEHSRCTQSLQSARSQTLKLFQHYPQMSLYCD